MIDFVLLACPGPPDEALDVARAPARASRCVALGCPRPAPAGDGARRRSSRRPWPCSSRGWARPRRVSARWRSSSSAAAIVLTLRALEARVFRDPARTIERVAGGVEPELAGRAVRALSLLRPEAGKGASSELAHLHVTRTLAALPREGVMSGASRLARLFLGVALVFAVTNIAACATNPWGVVEGFDVLIAKGGVAPLGMAWLTEPQVRARPPDYLHQEERRVVSVRGRCAAARHAAHRARHAGALWPAAAPHRRQRRGPVRRRRHRTGRRALAARRDGAASASSRASARS